MDRSLTPWAAGAFLAAALALASPQPARAADLPPLNTPASGQQLPGKFVWADLFSNDAAAAAAFYSNLLGWTSTPIEQKSKFYYVLSNNGQPVAGVVQREGAPAGRPSVWIGYIAVADARATLAAATRAGGIVHAPARKFPTRGLQAILSDDEGSVVGILQSSSGDRPDMEPAPGDWNWFELFTTRARETARFYRTVFGYEVADDTREGLKGHLTFSSGGMARAGVAPLTAGPDVSSGWLGCLRVADIDQTVQKAASLGGKVVEAPEAAVLGSRFAVIADPTGGELGLIQYVDNQNPADRP